MAKTPAPNTATNTAPNNASNLPNFDDFEDEQVGFAPYWNPGEAKFFFGCAVARDERDPEFIRYMFKAGMDTDCLRGPSDAPESVVVKRDDFFTVSVYFSLAPIFDFYLESGLPIYAKVTALKEVKTKKVGQTCWTWRVQISKTDKALAEAKRKALQLAGKPADHNMSDAAEFPPS